MYELSVAAGVDGKYPIEVRLLDKQKAIARSTLDWYAPAQNPGLTPAGPNAGIGDPLQTKRRPQIWTWGEEESTLTTAARSVSLPGGRNGLLIDQMAGFDHPKRRHYLYVMEGDKLLRAWTATEGAGPHWTTVEVLTSASAGSQDVVLFDGFRPGGDQPDSLKVERLAWDEKTRKLTPSAARGGFYAVTLGPWPTIAETRQAQSQAGECLSSYWLVPLARAEGAERYALRVVTAHKALAAETLRQAQSCAPTIKGSLSNYRP